MDVTQPTTTLLACGVKPMPVCSRKTGGPDAGTGAAGRWQRLSPPGQLEFSEVTVDIGTGSVTLRALMPNPERLLLPGMFVRERIEEGVRQGAVLAPQQSVTHNQKGEASALVVGPNDVVELRTLQTDRAVGDQWLVTSGLKAGDRVIVEGLQLARPGSTVMPQEYRPPQEAKSTPQSDAATQTATE